MHSEKWNFVLKTQSVFAPFYMIFSYITKLILKHILAKKGRSDLNYNSAGNTVGIIGN
jgi:hypothetical protein